MNQQERMPLASAVVMPKGEAPSKTTGEQKPIPSDSTKRAPPVTFRLGVLFLVHLGLGCSRPGTGTLGATPYRAPPASPSNIASVDSKQPAAALTAEENALVERAELLATSGNLDSARTILEQSSGKSNWLVRGQLASVSLRGAHFETARQEFESAARAFTLTSRSRLSVEALPTFDRIPSFAGVGWLGQGNLVVYQNQQRQPRFTIWEIQTGQISGAFQFSTPASEGVFAAPSLRVALAQNDGSIRIHSLFSGQFIAQATERHRNGYCLALSPSGRVLVSCANTSAQVGPIDPSVPPVELEGTPSYEIVSLLFSKDESAVIGSTKHGIFEWSARTGRVLKRFTEKEAWAIALSMDAQMLARADVTPVIDVPDVATQRSIRMIHAHGAGRNLTYVGADLASLVGFDPESTIEVWSVSRAKKRWGRRICAHSVYATLEPSPDGHSLAVKCDDSIEVVDAASGETRLSIRDFERLPVQVAFGKKDVLLTQDYYRARLGPDHRSIAGISIRSNEATRSRKQEH